jgi:hypothetical protein
MIGFLLIVAAAVRVCCLHKRQRCVVLLVAGDFPTERLEVTLRAFRLRYFVEKSAFRRWDIYSPELGGQRREILLRLVCLLGFEILSAGEYRRLLADCGDCVFYRLSFAGSLYAREQGEWKFIERL